MMQVERRVFVSQRAAMRSHGVTVHGHAATMVRGARVGAMARVGEMNSTDMMFYAAAGILAVGGVALAMFGHPLLGLVVGAPLPAYILLSSHLAAPK